MTTVAISIDNRELSQSPRHGETDTITMYDSTYWCYRDYTTVSFFIIENLSCLMENF